MITLRRLHRWTAIVAAVFLLNKAITGAWLAYDEIFVARQPAATRLGRVTSPALPGMAVSGAAAQEGTTSPISDAQALSMLTVVNRAARRAEPDVAIASIRLRVLHDEPQGVVAFAGPAPHTRVFDAHSGDTLSSAFSLLTRHQLLKSLHRGDVFGFGGRFLDVAVGLSLLFLAGSSLVMYGQLWSARRRLGRKGWFWR